MLFWTFPSQRFLSSSGIAAADTPIEHSAEVFECYPIPRPVAEELVSEASEEALARRIIRRACLLRHRSGDSVPAAYSDPSRPPAMTPAITVKDRTIVALQPADRLDEGGIGKLCVRASRQFVRHRLPIETAHDNGRVAFEAREGELGYVGKPRSVRGIRMEAARDFAAGMRADLAFAGAVSAPSLIIDRSKTLLAHDATRSLLGNASWLASIAAALERHPYALRAESLPASLENRPDSPAVARISAGCAGGCLSIATGAA